MTTHALIRGRRARPTVAAFACAFLLTLLFGLPALAGSGQLALSGPGATGSAGEYDFAVTLSDRLRDPAPTVTVTIDGAAHVMTSSGWDGQHARFKVTVALGAGLHHYVFTATDGGTSVSSPGTGTYELRVDGTPSPSPTPTPTPTGGSGGSQSTSGSVGGSTSSTGSTTGSTSGSSTGSTTGSSAGSTSGSSAGSSGGTTSAGSSGTTTSTADTGATTSSSTTTDTTSQGPATDLGGGATQVSGQGVAPTTTTITDAGAAAASPSVAPAVPQLTVEPPAGGIGRGGEGDRGTLAALFGNLPPPGSDAWLMLVARSVALSTTISLSVAMALFLFGRRKRDEDEAPPPREPSRYEPPPDLAVQLPTADEGERSPEDALPRWRRPSLLAARKSTPGLDLEVVEAQRLTFEHAVVEPTPDHERRRIRYRMVRLTDKPDEILGVELGRLDEGDEVELITSYGAYWRVRTPLGQEGWVHRMTLGEATAGPGVTGSAWERRARTRPEIFGAEGLAERLIRERAGG